VSPRFDFDPRTYAASGIDFYELGIKQYANLFHEGRGRFDVIRVTGSEFQEVMTSFRVSKRLAVTGALLGVAVYLIHRVIDIAEADAVGVAGLRRVPGQIRQDLGGDLVELADMPEGERPKERA